MPKQASLEQRMEWHREHQAQCACRPIPARLLEQMALQKKAQGQKAQRQGKKGAELKSTRSRSASSLASGGVESSVARSGSSAQTSGAEDKFSNVVLAFAKQPSVTYGGKGFGSSALKFSGKIFAMLTSTGQFVVKLSRERVEEQVGLSQGEYFDPGHGRLMKEWLVVPAKSTLWLELAKEAHATAARRPSRISRPPPARGGKKAVKSPRARAS